MIAFALAATLMASLALAFLLPPLLRKHATAVGASPAQANIAVYRHQLSEVEADVRSGMLGAEQLDVARRELERRLLDDVSRADGPSSGPLRRSPRAAVAVAVFVPLAALLIYAQLGSHQALRGRQAGESLPGSGHAMAVDQIETLAERLAARLEAQPGDAEGYAMLARTYGVLGRGAEAVSAYAKAAALAPGDAQLLADYADALAVSKGGGLEGAPMKLVQRALQADPHNAKALALAGTAAFDKKRYRAAVGYWERALGAAGDDPEFSVSIQESLEEARALSGTVRARVGGAPESEAASLASRTAARPSARSGVSGSVAIAPDLAKGLAPADTVFIFARAAEGPRMPLAMLTRQVKDLPMEFVLDDASSMIAGRKLSDAQRVVLVARVSRTGAAEPQPGDVEGTSAPVAIGTHGVHLRIDTTVR